MVHACLNNYDMKKNSIRTYTMVIEKLNQYLKFNKWLEVTFPRIGITHNT